MKQFSNFYSKKYNFIFIIIPSFLTSLLPLFLITGPFLPDLAVSLCALLFIFNSFYSSKKQYYQSKFFIFFLIFWITIIISSLSSLNIFYSLETSFFYIRFGLFVLSTWYLLDNNKKLPEYFFKISILCFVILIFDGYFQFFTGSNILGWKLSGTRISSFFKEQLVLGSYLVRIFPIIFALFIIISKKNNIFYNFLLLCIFILVETLIFISGERASFFFLNLSSVFIIILSKKCSKLRFLLLFISLAIITLITFFYDTKYKERIFDYSIEQIIPQQSLENQNLKDKKFYIFSVEHENHYKSALLMFKENPFLGIGPKLFRKNCDKLQFKISSESCTTHPHNSYVQLLAEVGILGFLQIFFFFLTLIYFSFLHLKLKLFNNSYFFNDFEIVLISALLITLWPFVPTGNFFGNWINIIYYLPLGFLLFSLKKRRKIN